MYKNKHCKRGGNDHIYVSRRSVWIRQAFSAQWYCKDSLWAEQFFLESPVMHRTRKQDKESCFAVCPTKDLFMLFKPTLNPFTFLASVSVKSNASRIHSSSSDPTCKINWGPRESLSDVWPRLGPFRNEPSYLGHLEWMTAAGCPASILDSIYEILPSKSRGPKS